MGPSQSFYFLNNLYPGGKYSVEIIIDTILGGDQSESTMANFTLGTPRSTKLLLYYVTTRAPRRSAEWVLWELSHPLLFSICSTRRSETTTTYTLKIFIFQSLVFCTVKCFSHDHVTESFQISFRVIRTFPKLWIFALKHIVSYFFARILFFTPAKKYVKYNKLIKKRRGQYCSTSFGSLLPLIYGKDTEELRVPIWAKWCTLSRSAKTKVRKVIIIS